MMNEDRLKKGMELNEEELDGVSGGQGMGFTFTGIATPDGQTAEAAKQGVAGLNANFTVRAMDPTNKDNMSKL